MGEMTLALLCQSRTTPDGFKVKKNPFLDIIRPTLGKTIPDQFENKAEIGWCQTDSQSSIPGSLLAMGGHLSTSEHGTDVDGCVSVCVGLGLGLGVSYGGIPIHCKTQQAEKLLFSYQAHWS